MKSEEDFSRTEPFEVQDVLTDLLGRMKTEGTPRSFGAVQLSDPESQLMSNTETNESEHLSRSEYVILWSLMSVSRSRESEGGYLTAVDLNRMLSDILRSENPRMKERFEDFSTDPNNTVAQLVVRINQKLSTVLKTSICILNDGGGPSRGYYLKNTA